MRVFNLTDVETPVLVSRGLVNTSIQVGGVVIQPGESADVPNPAGAQVHLNVGAIAFDIPPGEYLKRKAEVRSRKPVEESPPSTPEPSEDLTRAGAREEPEEEEEETPEEPTPGKKTRKRRGGRNR